MLARSLYIYIYTYISFVKMRHLSLWYTFLDVKSPDFPRAKSLTSATWVLWFDFLVPWLGWQRWRQRLSMGGFGAKSIGFGTWLMDFELDDSPFPQGFWRFESPLLCLFVRVLFSFHFDVFLVVEKRGLVLHDSMNSWWFGLSSSRTVSSSVSHLHIYTYYMYIYVYIQYRRYVGKSDLPRTMGSPAIPH